MNKWVIAITLTLACEQSTAVPAPDQDWKGIDRAKEIIQQIESTLMVSTHCAKENAAVDQFVKTGNDQGWRKVDPLDHMRAIFFLDRCKLNIYQLLLQQEIETAVDNGWACRDIALSEGRYFQRICVPGAQ